MYHVNAGTDTYGRVKVVGKTPIVTRFWMLYSVPIVPLTSFYYEGTSAVHQDGIPLVASFMSVSVRGLPLASVDRFSVAIAYVRALMAGLMVIGFMAIFPLIMLFTGEHLDELAWMMFWTLLGCFASGIVGGVITYLIPFQVSPRERQIRLACGEILQLCADPAQIAPEIASQLAEATAGTAEPLESAPRADLCMQLIRTRAQIALGHDPAALEQVTNDILHRLAMLPTEAANPWATPAW